MNFIKSICRGIVYVIFWVSVLVLTFLACGIIGSFYYDGVDETIGVIYGFTMLIIPPVVSTLCTVTFGRKWVRKQVKKRAVNHTDHPSLTTEPAAPITEPTVCKDVCLETDILSIDLMEGHVFEYWCADALRDMGFTRVEVTPGSGDQGVDVLAQKDGIKYAVQCKCYSSNLGNTPIQEVTAGKSFYHCHVGVVLTNQYFTPGAKELAEATGTLLWDRDWIKAYLRQKQNKEAMPNDQKLQSSQPNTDDLVERFFHAAVEVFFETNQASASILERNLNLSYAQASVLIEEAHRRGIISDFEESRPRRILISKDHWEKIRQK